MDSSLIDWSSCTPVYYKEGKKKYNVFRSTYKNIRYRIRNYTLYTIKASDMGRIPMICYRYYGNTAFWRVVLKYNGLMNGYTDIYPGQTIKLPDKADIISLLSQQPDTDNGELEI